MLKVLDMIFSLLSWIQMELINGVKQVIMNLLKWLGDLYMKKVYHVVC
ncbi:unnamed protein product [Schistosoma curassoni]|uniref:Uncharacterized protein n=1 Tax=Schistosoma curassoni TaxID=6186 RepID=A0A183JUD0_9TREM|nr:unnamed protein product [Schistosoma curassoni]